MVMVVTSPTKQLRNAALKFRPGGVGDCEA